MSLNDDIEFLFNDNFKVLYVLYDHQCNINGEIFSPMTQKELAENLQLNIMTINKIIKILIKNGYIDRYRNSKGRYVLTAKGNKIIGLVKKI